MRTLTIRDMTTAIESIGGTLDKTEASIILDAPSGYVWTETDCISISEPYATGRGFKMADTLRDLYQNARRGLYVPDAATGELAEHDWDDVARWAMRPMEEGKTLDFPAIGKEDASTAAALLGKLGGSVKSERKARASRKNGKKGGRPKTAKTESGFDPELKRIRALMRKGTAK